MLLLQIDPNQVSSAISVVDNWYSLAALFLILTSYILVQIYFKKKEKTVNTNLIKNVEDSNTSILNAIQNLTIAVVDLKTCIQTQNVNHLDLNNSLELIEEIYTGSKNVIFSYVQEEILVKNNIHNEFRLIEIDKKLRSTIFTLYVEDYTILGRFYFKSKSLNFMLTEMYANEVYTKLMEIIRKIVKSECQVEDIKSFLDSHFNSIIRNHQEIISNI